MGVGRSLHLCNLVIVDPEKELICVKVFLIVSLLRIKICAVLCDVFLF